MKLIFALYGDTTATPLLEPAFREALAGAGATRLQVNLDDGAVAPAMRFGPGSPASGAPIAAVVTLWAAPRTSVAQAVASLVQDVAPDADGWSVEERTPIPPPAVRDGERADALANLAFLRIPEAMAYDDWRTTWQDSHTQVAIDTQGTFGYVQNRVLEPLPGTSTDVAAIVEELFPMAAMGDHHAFYGSGGDEAEFERRFAALMASCARFGADQGLDLVPTSRYDWGLD